MGDVTFDNASRTTSTENEAGPLIDLIFSVQTKMSVQRAHAKTEQAVSTHRGVSGVIVEKDLKAIFANKVFPGH